MTVNGVPVVAIDGPTGSGKGAISRSLAVGLGWCLLDSGALYRSVALKAYREGLGLKEPEALAAAVSRMQVEFSSALDPEAVFLDGEDVTALLRTEECGAMASRIAAIPEVREALWARQRAFARPPGLIADGRDMGTVVFPEAELKVYLTASPEERARRRYKQLIQKGIDVSLPDLSEDIARRDERDANRVVAPLKPAEDARVLDSTGLSPEEVSARIQAWLRVTGLLSN
ncbi:MAG: (d)CMP kinase [Rhodospirillaceae bacterium]|nr:(d)CMP kinase [Rhodospirillaceae bacterium]